ncbi:MAG: (4Fe-4S)-binding protein [Dysgonomonas sp.]
MGKILKYSNGEITVVWEPALCMHAGNCMQMLPEVYRPDKRSWIDVSKASTEELVAQIGCCPTGALSFTKDE